MLGDDSEAPTRVGTPAIDEEKAPIMADNGTATPEEGSTPVDGSEKGAESIPRSSMELPQDVRAKLRRAAKIEATYQGMFMQ